MYRKLTEEKWQDWDVARFARERLGFDADTVQSLVMNGRIHRGLLNCTRYWGKSTIGAIMALHRAYTREGTLTIAATPSGGHTTAFMRTVRRFARTLGLKSWSDGGSETSVALPNESRIVGLPGSETHVRRFSTASLMVIDDAARVSDEMYRAVRPFVAIGRGDLLMMSTPFGRRGFFYEEWARGGTWSRFKAPAAQCSRIAAGLIEEEKAVMGELWVRQEYMCEFVNLGGSAFDQVVLERAFSEDVGRLVRRGAAAGNRL